MSNPGSANIKSQGKMLLRKPECSVMCLSLTRPHYAFEIKDTVHCDVIPIKTFNVLWCVYEDHVSARSFKFEGLSINTINKQSIITAHFDPKCFLNCIDIVFIIPLWMAKTQVVSFLCTLHQ